MRMRYCSTIARDVTRRCSMAARSSGIVASTTVNGVLPGSGSPLCLAWAETGATAARRATGTRTTVGRDMVAPILRLHQAPRLVDDQLRVDAVYVVGHRGTVRPANLEAVHPGGRTQPEVHPEVGLRQLAPAARHLAPLPEPVRGAEHHRADRVTRAAS